MPRKATVRPSGETDGQPVHPRLLGQAADLAVGQGHDVQVLAQVAIPSLVALGAEVTTPEESASQATPLCWNGPGVRLRGGPVPSAATT